MSTGSSTEWWRPRGPGPARPDRRTVLPRVGRAPGAALTFWALVAFTVILLLAPQNHFPVLAPLRIALLSVIVAFLACGYSRVKRRLPLLELSPDVTLLLMFAFWAALMLPFSVWPGGSAGFMLGTFLKAFLCFLLLSHAVTDSRQLRGICWCLVLCAIPLALTTLKNYVAGIHVAEGTSRVAGSAAGLTQNPNDMALTLNLILPLCLALLLGARNGFARLMLAGTAVLIAAAVVATFSRAGFLTLVLIVVSFAWLVRKRPQRIWIPIVLILGLFALPLVPSSYYERIDTIVNIEEDRSNSAQSRLADMKVAAGVVLSKPLIGSGIGMSILAMNEARGDHWVDVHNVYLQVALDLGLVGLLLYLLLLLRCFRTTAEARHRHDRGEPVDEQLVWIGEALGVSLLAFALSAMFYPVAYNFYLFYFAGLAIALGRIVRQEVADGS